MFERSAESRTSDGRAAGVLATPAFLICLGVLLLNDLLWKQAWPAPVTGKVSDFAGLFVFPLFWTALAPRRRVAIHLATAVTFVWWKSAWSQPFIESWNAVAPFSVSRTVDPTDLVALVAVAAAYGFSARPRWQLPVPALEALVVPLSLFAFAATSFLSVHRYDRTYLFRTSPVEIRRHLAALGIKEWAPHDVSIPVAREDGTGALGVSVPTECCGPFEAHVYLEVDPIGTALTMQSVRLRAPPSRQDSIALITAFEQCLVQRVDSLLTGGVAIRELAVQLPNRTQRNDYCPR